MQVQDGGQQLGGAVPVGGGVVAEAGDDPGAGRGCSSTGPFQPVSPRPVCQRPRPDGEVGQFRGPDVELAAGAWSGPAMPNWKAMSSSRRAGSVRLGLLHRDAGHLADGEQPAGVAVEDLAVHLGDVVVDARAARSRGGRDRSRRLRGRFRRAGPDPLEIRLMTSMRKPSTPHSSHQRIIAYTTWRTSGLSPVQVGLLAGEGVRGTRRWRHRTIQAGPENTTPGCSVPLPAFQAPCPHAAGARWPDRAARPSWSAVAGGGEPGVLVTGVVDDQVHHQFHATFVHRGQQPVEVGERAEERVDVLVVADVVAVVVVRRGIDEESHSTSTPSSDR